MVNVMLHFLATTGASAVTETLHQFRLRAWFSAMVSPLSSGSETSSLLMCDWSSSFNRNKMNNTEEPRDWRVLVEEMERHRDSLQDQVKTLLAALAEGTWAWEDSGLDSTENAMDVAIRADQLRTLLREDLVMEFLRARRVNLSWIQFTTALATFSVGAKGNGSRDRFTGDKDERTND